MHREKNNLKAWTLVVCLLVLLFGAAGGTIAYLNQVTDPITNTFQAATVACQVEETFSGSVKENVAVRNTGNVPAYIRACVLISWVEEKTGKVHAQTPSANTDYTLQWASTQWVLGADGYMYYCAAVPAGEKTEYLITSIVPTGQAPEGYRLSVQVLASAIQTQPEEVVTELWNVTVTDTAIQPATAQ